MNRKGLVVGLILILIGTSVIPITAKNLETSQSTSRGEWLYVGGSGPGNYTKIQDAINNSSSGDTIYVYRGTYHEAIEIDVVNLKILGEGRDVTIIDANFTDIAVVIRQSYVTLQGFTLIGQDDGINVRGELTAITISDNNLTKNWYGIEFQYDWDNNWIVIENNIFYSNTFGIYLVSWYEIGFNTIRNNTFIDNSNGMNIGGKNNRISNNTFLNYHGTGMSLYGESSTVQNNKFIENNCGLNLGGSDHTITGNIFIGNGLGLNIDGSQHRITGNLIENNSLGLRASTASNTIVYQNNFMKNEKHARFYETNRSHGNNWDNNYWSDSLPLFGCIFIFGKVQTGIKKLIQFDPYGTSYYWIPWINFDRNPAQEPHDI